VEEQLVLTQLLSDYVVTHSRIVVINIVWAVTALKCALLSLAVFALECVVGDTKVDERGEDIVMFPEIA
jgi:hypothetical protein